MFLFGLLSLSFIIATSFLLIRLFRAKYFSEGILLFFLFSTAQISLQGFAISCFKKLNSVEYWFLASFFTFILVLLVTRFFHKINHHPDNSKRTPIERGRFRATFSNLGRLNISLLALLFGTVIICGLLNLALILFTTPFGHDSLAYWVARVGYFVQQGSLDYFEANQFWIAHRPKIQTILLIFSYLASNQNENLMQVINYLAYWVAAGSVYYLCRVLNLGVARSLFASLIFCLLINPLMVSTTTQNDLLLATYIGIFIGFCFSFQKTRKTKYLIMAAIGAALAFNVKEIFVFCVPAIGVIALYTFFPGKEIRSGSAFGFLRPYLKTGGTFAVYLAIFIAIFALPSGYWDNLKHHGNFIVVPKEQAAANYFNLGPPLKYLSASAMNGLRFSVDFITLDGLPSENTGVQAVQRFIKGVPEKFLKKLNLDLATNYDINHGNYIKNKSPVADGVLSYWGILGFLLVWPVVFLHIFNVFKKKDNWNKDFLVLGLATIVFFISQAMIGEYDVWRGRYFTPAAIMAVPLTASVFGLKNKIIKFFLMTIVLLGCVSAFSAILFRNNSEIINYCGRKSIFLRDRYEQLTRDVGGREVAMSYRKFDTLVPFNATVAQWVGSAPYEYMYFGPKLSRRVLPLTFWEDGAVRIHYNADYMVYHSDTRNPQTGDIPLGRNQFLRKLFPPMRFEENLALSRNGGKPVARGDESLFSVSNLNDGTERPWSTKSSKDIAFGIARKKPFYARTIQLVLYSPEGAGHLRDISVVATNNARLPLPEWKILESRIAGSPSFQKKITIPQGYDEQVVMIEIDKDDSSYSAYKVIGITCLSESQSQYRQNYTPGQPGISVREILISQENPEHFEPILKAREENLSSYGLYAMDYLYYQPTLLSSSDIVNQYMFEKNINSLLIKPEENLALRRNGGFAGATSNENNFPTNSLNDGTSKTWGGASKKDWDDTAFFIAHKKSYLPGVIQIVLFSPNGNAHLRDLSVVATDNLNQPLNKWTLLKSRISGSPLFKEEITIPEKGDEEVVTIEIDKSDPNYRPYKVFGLACLSRSADYDRNYLNSIGAGVYVREILMSR